MRGLQGEGGITWTYKMLQAEMTQVSKCPICQCLVKCLSSKCAPVKRHGLPECGGRGSLMCLLAACRSCARATGKPRGT